MSMQSAAALPASEASAADAANTNGAAGSATPRARWRTFRLVILAALLLAAGLTAWQLTDTLNQRADGMSRYNRVDTWAVQQAEYELQKLRNAFARHAAGDPQANVAALRKQAAVARGVIPLMRRGDNYAQFRLYVDLDGVAEGVVAALDRVDALLGDDFHFRALPKRDVLRTVDLLLDAPTDALRRLAVDVSHARLALQDGDLANVRWLIAVNKWMVSGFLACTALFVAMLGVEVRSARRAERAAVRSERRVRHTAEHDTLTGLANRSVFDRDVDRMLAAARARGQDVALFMLDLDGFKEINDTFGHHVGDALLVAVAERLGCLLSAGDYLTRLGGDEFVLAHPSRPAVGGWEETARRVMTAFEAPFEFDDRHVFISSSIGIAVFPRDGADAATLLKAADLALYAAKAAGKARFAVFAPAMVETLTRRKTLEEALRESIALGGLELYLQPQVTLADGRCFGAEALTRWIHPTLGFVSPGEFIPVAEQSGLILPLGRWVMEEACRQAMLWDGALAGGVVAINVSPAQFLFEDIVEEVKRVLALTGLPAPRLELEITEGLLMHDRQAAVDTLARLDALGCRLAIDDFGTGYSSLAYLKHFRLHKLKIDRAFVKDCETDAKDREIGAAIATLAHGLGMATIAEGIETEGQARLVAAMGVREGQGFLYCKPIPAAEFRQRYRAVEATAPQRSAAERLFPPPRQAARA